MRYLLFLSIAVSILYSCKTVKESVIEKPVQDIQRSVLSSSDQRKFDYFFYEAQRLKVQGKIDKTKLYLLECLKIDSLSSACYYELANIEIGYKNFKGAQELLSQAVRLDPDNKWYKMLLGDLYQQNKDLPGSISIYEQLVLKFPENEEYLYILAQLYSQNKQYQSAIESYDKLQQKIGLNEIISLEKEKLYLQLGKKNLAYKEIQNLIKDNPYEPKYYGFLGDVYFYNKELDKAKEAYSKILSVDPGNGMGLFSLANVALQETDTVSFFNYYKNAIKDKDLSIDIKIQRLLPFLMGNDFDNYKDTLIINELFSSLIDVHNEESKGYNIYANYLKNQNDLKGAIEAYKKGLVIENTDASVWQELFLLQINTGEFNALLHDTEEALIIFPDEPVFNLFNGMAYMQDGNNAKALQSLQHGLKFVGDNRVLKGQYHSYLGDVLYSLDKKEDAYLNYEEALLIDEHNVVVLNNFSYYLSLENKDLDRAEQMISKCIELEPGNSTYLDTYAWVLFKRGRYFEAKYIIERALDNGGGSSEVIVEHYGDILYKNGNVSEALIQWKKSLEMGNDSEVLLKKIDKKVYVED